MGLVIIYDRGGAEENENLWENFSRPTLDEHNRLFDAHSLHIKIFSESPHFFLQPSAINNDRSLRSFLMNNQYVQISPDLITLEILLMTEMVLLLFRLQRSLNVGHTCLIEWTNE